MNEQEKIDEVLKIADEVFSSGELKPIKRALGCSINGQLCGCILGAYIYKKHPEIFNSIVKNEQYASHAYKILSNEIGICYEYIYCGFDNFEQVLSDLENNLIEKQVSLTLQKYAQRKSGELANKYLGKKQ